MYDSLYRGLPAEIRLMIFRLALQVSIPRELVFGRDSDWQVPRGSQRCHRPMPICSETPCLPEHTLVQLNSETRAEAFSVLPTDITLNLANLRMPHHLTDFLENINPLVYQMTSRVIIDRSSVQLLPGIWVTGASRAEDEDLNNFIDNLPHLNSLIYVIDAARWQGSTAQQKDDTAPGSLTPKFRYLWDEGDTETLHSQFESGRVRSAKLYITVGRWWSTTFLEWFKDECDPLDRWKVEKKRVRLGLETNCVDEHTEHSFFEKFCDTGFLVITLTKR